MEPLEEESVQRGLWHLERRPKFTLLRHFTALSVVTMARKISREGLGGLMDPILDALAG